MLRNDFCEGRHSIFLVINFEIYMSPLIFNSGPKQSYTYCNIPDNYTSLDIRHISQRIMNSGWKQNSSVFIHSKNALANLLYLNLSS